MQYEIVDKPGDLKVRGKWQIIFRPLPLNKAAKFIFDSRKEASIRAHSMLGSVHADRQNTFTAHYRIIPDEGRFILYVWKEQKEGK